jgi:hypothetical protein
LVIEKLISQHYQPYKVSNTAKQTQQELQSENRVQSFVHGPFNFASLERSPTPIQHYFGFRSSENNQPNNPGGIFQQTTLKV